MTGERGPRGDHGQTGDEGSQGITGERGGLGARGVTGERGPKGDHGQSGDEGLRGEQGPQGEPGGGWWTRKASASFLVLALVFSIVVFWGSYQQIQLRDSAKKTNELAEENCFNIEVNRHYYDVLARSLNRVIRASPPGADLRLLLELAGQAALTRDAMITARCQEIQG